MGRRWTEEEEEYLSSFWGIRSLENISKYLNRTQYSVEKKLARMGISSSKLNSDFIPVYDIIFLLDGYRTSITLERFLAKGLNVRTVYHRNKKVKAVKIENFWAWAENNQDKLNFRKFEEFALGEEPSWVQQKRKKDREKSAEFNYKRWTPQEESYLMLYKKLGKSDKEISLLLKRTEDSIRTKFRLLYKGKKGESYE